MAKRTCSESGCDGDPDKPGTARGLCQRHYREWKKAHPSEVGVRLFWPQNLLHRLRLEPYGCIRWTGTPYKNGYGYVGVNGVRTRVHIAAWRHFIGPIPHGLTLDHLCCDPAWCSGGVTCPHRTCVRLDHLALASPAENAMRGNNVAAVNARKTHCHRGHEFTEENTYVFMGSNGRPHRACRRCVAFRLAAGG